MPRKSITLTAGYDTAYYTVSVLSGTGSGDYALGDEVTVEAENPDAGYEFIGWKVSRGNISLSDRQSMKVLFEMPEENVELEAQYQPIEYQLNVQNGFGGGSYHLGDTVSISADPLKDGMIFSYWSVDAGTLEFSDASAANLTFRMPAEDLVITAHYSVKKYTLKVENGRGSGMYSPQDTVTITADTPKDSQTVFHSWSIVSGTFKGEEPDLIQQELTFHMPENDLVLQANYMTVQMPEKEPAQTEKYTLTVNGGTGSGTYPAGEQIRITHDAPAEGMSFTGWIVFWNQESKEMDSDTLTLTMPECDVIVTAVFS